MACPRRRARWTIALRLGADAPIGRSALCRLRSTPGPVHSCSSGCWITWDRQSGKNGIVAVSTGRIGKNGYVEGYVQPRTELGRASWSERGCQYVWISLLDVELTKNKP